MAQEDKDLLFRDICARLPYGVIGAVTHYDENDGEGCDLFGRIEGINHRNEVMFVYLPEYTDDVGAYNDFDYTLFKPCLRPMSSMTEEEKKEYQSLCEIHIEHDADDNITYYYFDTIESFDWLNKNMFDYRGLIPKGQALSTEEFNPYKNEIMAPTSEVSKNTYSTPQEREITKLPDFTEPLTLREQSAIAAMKGIISNNRYNGSTDMVAKSAVKYADALIKELNLDKD